MKEIKKAYWVRNVLEWSAGDAAMYYLSHPIVSDEHPEPIHYVIVSAVKRKDVHQTDIFAAPEEGMGQCWLELPGSVRNTTSHARALEDYEIVKTASWRESCQMISLGGFTDNFDPNRGISNA